MQFMSSKWQFWQIGQIFCTAFLLATLNGNATWAQSRFTERESTKIELEEVTNSLSAAEQRQEDLKKYIQVLDQDVGAINRALIEGAKRGQELEDSIMSVHDLKRLENSK